jgi:hypothetical protein
LKELQILINPGIKWWKAREQSIAVVSSGFRMDNGEFGQGEIAVLDPDGEPLLRNARQGLRSYLESVWGPKASDVREGIQNKGVYVVTFRIKS